MGAAEFGVPIEVAVLPQDDAGGGEKRVGEASERVEHGYHAGRGHLEDGSIPVNCGAIEVAVVAHSQTIRWGVETDVGGERIKYG